MLLKDANCYKEREQINTRANVSVRERVCPFLYVLKCSLWALDVDAALPPSGKYCLCTKNHEVPISHSAQLKRVHTHIRILMSD